MGFRNLQGKIPFLLHNILSTAYLIDNVMKRQFQEIEISL